MKEIRNLRVFVVAPNFKDGAQGHWSQYPKSMLEGFSNIGVEGKIIGNSIGWSGVGYALLDRNFPIVSIGFVWYLMLHKIRQTGPLLIHCVDIRTPTIPIFELLKRMGLVSFLSLTVLDGPDVISGDLRNKLLKKVLDSSAFVPQVYGPTQQAAFSSHGIRTKISAEICTIKVRKRTAETLSPHGSQLVVARGSRLLKMFLEASEQLCSRCTYFVHLPEQLREVPLPVNMLSAPRLLSDEDYVDFLASHRSHLYLYDPEMFDLPSGRVLDSQALGVPFGVPKSSSLALQLSELGGGFSFPETSSGLVWASNHPPQEPIRRKVLRMEDYCQRQIEAAIDQNIRTRPRIALLLAYSVRQYTNWLVTRIWGKTGESVQTIFQKITRSAREFRFKPD